MKALSIVGLFASALSLAASPVVIYSSFGDEQSFDAEQFYTIGTTTENEQTVTLARAQSFVADNDYLLNAVRVGMTYDGVGVPSANEQLLPGDFIRVTIHEDDFDLPGNSIHTFFVNGLNDLGGNVVEFQFETGVELEFGTQYWLSFETENSESFSTYNWYFAPDNKQALGATGYSDPFTQEPMPIDWSSAISNEAAFSLHGTVIPEPSVYAAGAALLVLSVTLYRRRNR